MNIICKLFDRLETDNIARSLGNMMISGVDNFGKRAAYNDLVKYQLLNNRTLLIFQDEVTLDEHSRLKALIATYGKKVYDVGMSSSFSKEIDIFSAFSTPYDKADFIVTMLGYLSEVSETVKTRAQGIFYHAIDYFESTGTPYNLEKIADLDLDELINLINLSSLPTAEKNKKLRFLSDSSTSSAFVDIEMYLLKMKSWGICRVLSGSKSCTDVFSGGNVTVFSGFASEDKAKRELFIKSVLYATRCCIETLVSSGPISVIFDSTDFMQDDVANSIMEYNATRNFAVYTILNDVSSYVNKNGNDLIDKTKSFLVFTQMSDQNARFWSGLFGSRDVQERSYSYTRKRGLFSSVIINSGGVVPTPKRPNMTTTNYHKVNKPIYRPEIFKELRPAEVMCYLREPLIRRKLRIEV